jgi:HK97 family phage portal protein
VTVRTFVAGLLLSARNIVLREQSSERNSGIWLGGGGWGNIGWWQSGLPSPLPPASQLAFPAVYTCIDTISSDIARLSFRHWTIKNGRREEVANSAALRVLDAPNGYQTGFDLMKMFIASQLYRGNSYLYARRNGRYEINELHCLYPDAVWPYISDSEVFYRVSATQVSPLAELDDVQTMLTTRECMHHRMLTLANPLFGVTPLVAAALSSAAGLAILNQSSRFFREMARPSGILTTAARLDPQRAEEIKQRWKNVYGGEANNAGDIAVLEQGLEWKQLTLTAVDAQLIEQLRYTVEDVGRVFRVPLFMLGDLTKVNYNSSEQLTRIYYSGCLAAHMDAIERRMSLFFGMDGRTEWLEFDLDELFRTEMAARIEALTKSVQGGLRTPNEARAIEGLNPVPGGEQIFMQQQMVPVETLATRTSLAPTGPQPPSPGPPPPPERTPPALPPPANDPALDGDALRDALMDAVFERGRPPARIAPPAKQQRKVIYGRQHRA